MSQDRKDAAVGRRDFLKLSGIAAATGGAALAAGNTQAEAGEAQSGSAAGYRETDHVKTYYKLARF